MKPLIGLDLDGVLYRWTESARQTFHVLRGKEIPDYGEDDHWNHIREFLTDEEWSWLWSDPAARRYCMGSGRAYADGIRAARELEKLTRVVIMTSRPADCMDVTMRWLALHNLCPHALVHVAPPQKKADHEFLKYCKVFVDDNPDNCLDIAATGIPVFCPVRKYNSVLAKEYHEDSPIRFHSWDSVIGWVRENVNAKEGDRG